MEKLSKLPPTRANVPMPPTKGKGDGTKPPAIIEYRGATYILETVFSANFNYHEAGIKEAQKAGSLCIRMTIISVFFSFAALIVAALR